MTTLGALEKRIERLEAQHLSWESRAPVRRIFARSLGHAGGVWGVHTVADAGSARPLAYPAQ